MKNPIVKLIINRVAGFIVFLLLVIVLNILVTYISLSLFQDIVGFINDNVLFLGLIALIMVLGEVFSMLKYPFNLPYPLFSAAGALFVLYFIFDIFVFLIEASAIDLGIPFDIIFGVIAILVFIVILVAGYYHIFKNLSEKQVKRKTSEEKPKQKQEPKKTVKKTTAKKQTKTPKKVVKKTKKK